MGVGRGLLVGASEIPSSMRHRPHRFELCNCDTRSSTNAVLTSFGIVTVGGHRIGTNRSVKKFSPGGI